MSDIIFFYLLTPLGVDASLATSGPNLAHCNLFHIVQSSAEASHLII